MSLPERSKRANIAFADREVYTVAGYWIVRGSIWIIDPESLSEYYRKTH